LLLGDHWPVVGVSLVPTQLLRAYALQPA
jgi:hypothetical protein